MRVLGVELQAFRSFIEPCVLRFDALRPGLYYVTGRNEVEPELGANACGKTSLFKGVYWGLFGEDDEGLRSPALKNWNSKLTTQVLIDIGVPQGRFDLFRSHDPNVLEVCSTHGEVEPVDQQQLEAGFGINASSFLFSMYFAQFAPMFVDLRPAEQTQAFSDALGLELWQRAIKRATTAASAAQVEVQTWREEKARIEGQIEELLSVSYDEDEKQWASQRQTAINTQVVELKRCMAATTQAQQAADTARVGTIHFDEGHVRAATAETELRLVEAEHARQSRAVVNLQRDDIKTCPECGAPVTREHVKKELRTALAELKKLDDELTKKKRTHSEALAKRDEYQHENDTFMSSLNALTAAEAEQRAADKELARLQIETNPYTALKQQNDVRGEEAVIQLGATLQRLNAAERAVKMNEGWVTGFKEIRLGEIRESVEQLTLEANEALFQHGLRDWSVSFDVEKETQSGSVRSGFTTMIKARGGKAVPFKSYCGGEKQRLRLSISMGYSNLIALRGGVAPNVEFWDEPSQGLSPQGIGDLLSVLAERAQRYSRVILLADHRVLDAGGFAGVITVVKDKNGSRIEA